MLLNRIHRNEVLSTYEDLEEAIARSGLANANQADDEEAVIVSRLRTWPRAGNLKKRTMAKCSRRNKESAEELNSRPRRCIIFKRAIVGPKERINRFELVSSQFRAKLKGLLRPRLRHVIIIIIIIS